MITTIERDETTKKNFDSCYKELADCVVRLWKQGEIAVEYENIEKTKGKFVTEGVTVFLKNRAIEIWSDESRELI